MKTLYEYEFVCGNCGKVLVKQIPKGMSVNRFADILEEERIVCENCGCEAGWC